MKEWNQKSRENLWDEDPERAARLAYLEIVLHWQEQVVSGQYEGIPCLHRKKPRPQEVESATSGVVARGYTPDQEAAVHEIPRAVIERWRSAA